MADRKPTLASRLFAGGGSAGLLGDPLFQVGMGLLAKGQDNRIPYATAVMQGLQGAQTARDQATRRQMLAEQARREKIKREAYENYVKQLFPNVAGEMAAQPVPNAAGTGMQMQMMGPPVPQEDPRASLLEAFAPEDGLSLIKSGLLNNTEAPVFADIQAPSPKDFTPDSLREYQITRDPSVLVRRPMTRIFTNKDDTQTLLDYSDPDNPQMIPITTPQDVADRAKDFRRLERGDPDYVDSAFEKIDQIQALIEDPVTGEPVDLAPILGPIDSVRVNRFPITASQESIDLNARLKNVISIAKLAQRGQLKGQGTISDFEAKMLGESVTALSDQNISPELARKELRKLIKRIEATLNKEDRPSAGGDDDGGL